MIKQIEELCAPLEFASPRVCEEKRTGVAVVGGGIAGSWVAYQLAKAGIETTLVTYDGLDRGGTQGSSRKSAGAFNLSLLEMDDLDGYLQELGRGQTHPSIAQTLKSHLPRALDELGSLVKLKSIKIGCALASGGGDQLLSELQNRFREMGGSIIHGWVTRLVADASVCQGLQYESAEGIGKLRCGALVLGSGGYTGLFANAIRTNCFGNVLGFYLQCGGLATNLEFLFKHGYGNVDANALTPTEELPGAEIYDNRHERVRWLEQLLFHRQGTKSHLQAVQFWLRNPDTEFFIDLTHRPLYLKLWALNRVIENPEEISGNPETEEARLLAELVQLFPETSRAEVLEKLSGWIEARTSIGYFRFEELKPYFKAPAPSKFRVRPLTYFSMGGIGHDRFATNLRNVYVTGEAMHDFGANRVGGLPWSLYLACAYSIVEQITGSLKEAEETEDFELIHKPSRFDAELLRDIQQRLYECQEKELTASRAIECIGWMRQQRDQLDGKTRFLEDGVSWLLVAEAVMQCSLCRAESRGFFFRFDFQAQDESYDQMLTCAWYDAAAKQISAELLPRDRMQARLGQAVRGGSRYGAVVEHR